jgi:hypothetical protein
LDPGIFYNRERLCSTILAGQTDESFRGVGGLVAANIEMSVDKPPQAELYADTYQPFRSCLGDVAFNCLGSRMYSIRRICITPQFVGDGLAGEPPSGLDSSGCGGIAATRVPGAAVIQKAEAICGGFSA